MFVYLTQSAVVLDTQG